MVTYFVALTHAFVPVAAAAGLLAAMAGGRRAVVAAVLSGLVLGWALPADAATAGRAVALGGALLAPVLVVVLPRLAPVALALVAAGAGADFLDAVADTSFTAASVLNTGLVLNSGALLLGTAALAGLAAVTAHAGRAAGRRPAWAVLAAVLLIQAAAWAAAVALGLLQLGQLAVSATRVSLLARAGALVPLAVYADLALVALLGLLAWARRPRPAIGSAVASASRPQRRSAGAAVRREARWARGTAAAVAVLAAVLLYHDLYASLPPSLSPAETVVPAADGTVRIPVDSVKDGALHRFAYVARDGHRVRFFLINRYDPEHPHIAVVFDACTICGDAGYIQDGDEVYCSACNVRLFRPSIGKPGGCNPIPIAHTVEDGQVVVAAAALEDGSVHFREVVAVTAADPVSGAALDTLSAPHRYDYEGTTYHFESRATYDAFRADPARYAQHR
ncbi:Fe-S-containing protein [Azospirillum sp. ST 5-10]|uniref:Fe-S-containing protein n=1 Tax=unclassified Azospirillum TaxID=2630922 RepID=UPI003F4A02A8